MFLLSQTVKSLKSGAANLSCFIFSGGQQQKKKNLKNDKNYS